MKTYHVEAMLSNAGHDGFLHCMTLTEEAGKHLADCVYDLLNDAEMSDPAVDDADGWFRNFVLVSSTFVDCDSTRSHGSCYFDLAYACTDPELAARIEAAETKLALDGHTGD